MTRINLLPWREAYRAQQQRNFVAMMLAAALVGAAIIAGWHVQVQAEIDAQQSRNDRLQQEIVRLNKAAEEIREMDRVKSRLLARLDTIKALQGGRPTMVQALDEVPRVVPEEAFLTTLASSGPAFKINGLAQSNNVVSEFMRGLGGSERFAEPVLTVVQNRELQVVRASEFELAVPRQLPRTNGEGASQ